ncbi:MAG: hypothetical protein LCH41_09455 [Armatimonadetes bacterium]|nr:hypothetical protein [Armatimonadota bacterium]
MNDLYHKLVDLYAGHELPEDLVALLEQAAQTDPSLAMDMSQARTLVDLLHTMPAPGFSEADHLRILFKMHTAASDLPENPFSPEQSETQPGTQYQLPMFG